MRGSVVGSDVGAHVRLRRKQRPLRRAVLKPAVGEPQLLTRRWPASADCGGKMTPIGSATTDGPTTRSRRTGRFALGYLEIIQVLFARAETVQGAIVSRVVLAMSGGVDSSVAAHLLLEQGHEVIGVFMRHGEESARACTAPASAGGPSLVQLPIAGSTSGHRQGCCSATDAEDARIVADRLEIPFFALDLREDFRGIIDYFVNEYSAGRTPNPCVMCNNWIKFSRLFDYADSIRADYVATGHYAQLLKPHRTGAAPALCRGNDISKDQSYVLFGIARQRLPRILLPIGQFHKHRIRQLAGKIGLRTADKPDSQEICFVTSGHHGDLVRGRRPGQDTSGEVVTTDGRVVARHRGIERFTVGQRKGLGVALGEPYFVVRIEPHSRRVVIGKRAELARDRVTANRGNWLVDPPAGAFRCTAMIRYNSHPAPATAQVLPDQRLQVVFDQPRFGVAPGQAVVCYDGPRVMGGGWIE